MWDDGACDRCGGHGVEWDEDSDYRRIWFENEPCTRCGGSGYEPIPIPPVPELPAPILSGWNEDPLRLEEP